jgi:galactofuranose transport system permease protein
MSFRVLKRNIPFVATISVCAILYAAAAFRFREDGFASWRVLILFFSENAFVGVAAIGMTLVILSGGIDLSVGSVVALVTILLAMFIQEQHIPPLLAIAIVLVFASLFGAAMGALIHFYNLPPFLITLAGMFMARGLALLLREGSIAIEGQLDPLVSRLTLPLGGGLELPATAVILLVLFAVALLLAHLTPFGRTVYAVGGNEQSAVLMGLPVGRTKIGVYALSGFCAGLAGVVNVLYTSSGNASAGVGLELDAIAAVVIGGTLLSGGVGYMAGTLVGVITFGIIQTAIQFQGTLSTWWSRIVIGSLLLGFILLQKIVQAKKLVGATH